MKKLTFSIAIAGIIFPLIAFITAPIIWVQRSIATPKYGINISKMYALEIEHDKLAEMFSEVASFYRWFTQLTNQHFIILIAFVVALSLISLSLSIVLLKNQKERL